MGRMRMFVAVRPSAEVIEELEEFLEARPQMRWTRPETWHLTLAFMERVPDARLDELVDRLETAAARVEPFAVRLMGGGAFPHAAAASVLWMGVNDEAAAPLERLAVAARAAANISGASPDGTRFVPHVTLARPTGRADASKWVGLLDTFYSSTWLVENIELVESFLGEGPRRSARHETVAHLPLADTPRSPAHR